MQYTVNNTKNIILAIQKSPYFKGFFVAKKIVENFAKKSI